VKLHLSKFYQGLNPKKIIFFTQNSLYLKNYINFAALLVHFGLKGNWVRIPNSPAAVSSFSLASISSFATEFLIDLGRQNAWE
jgi:hypothetical protein